MSLTTVDYFQGKQVRSFYAEDKGQCIVASVVWRAAEYKRGAGVKAIQRYVPDKYKMRLGTTFSNLQSVDRSVHTQPNTILLTEPGLYCFLLRCDQPGAESFLEWVVEEVLPREMRKLAAALGDRDMAMAVLAGDLEDRDDEIVFLEDELAVLEDQVETLQQRTVTHLEDPEKDNGMVVIQKNNNDPFPYLAICGQQGYVAQKIRNKLVDHPRGEIVVLAETPNAIVHYNWLRERGCIEVNPKRVRHFRLGEHYAHERLLELGE